MADPTNGTEVRWSSSPTAKTRNLVLRNVTAILDELAPERVVKRTDELQEVRQYRTPSGCVLQAPECAISVSWFDDASTEAPLGELHLVIWNGMVKRRGSINQGKGGTIVSDLIFRPSVPARKYGEIDREAPPATPVPEVVTWTAAHDGKEYATAEIAQKCMALLEEQMRQQGA
jgi:hypothetical protein